MFQILVVEDDADLQNLFCKTLIRNNYQAYGAKNVQHALNILEKSTCEKDYKKQMKSRLFANDCSHNCYYITEN